MIIEAQPTESIELGRLIGRVEQFRQEGYRLVQVNCTKIDSLFEINYSFDSNYQFRNIRITITPDTEVPSISGIFWGAFVYENEMHDLYGIVVRGMNIDYKGNLIRTTVKYPFSTVTPAGEDPCQNK
jgi:ech hydrogenase subunit D